MSLEQSVWLFVGLGLLLAVLAVPLILAKVKPNRWYGFRTAAALSREDVWYAANKRAGWWMLAVGLITAVFGWLLPQFAPTISAEQYTIFMTVVLMGSLGMALFFSWHFVASLLERERLAEEGDDA